MQPNESNVTIKKSQPYAVKSAMANVHIKDVDTTGRVVTGFYNSFNYFDSDQDVILPGAMNKSIKEHGPESDGIAKIKHLMFHDWKQLPGKIQVLKEQKENVQGVNILGTYFETLMAKTQLGTDTLTNYMENVYDNHSIGFQYMDGRYIDEEADDWDKVMNSLINPEDAKDAGYMFLWKEINLYEGSTVAFGANELTPYLGVKSGDKASVVLQLQQRIANITSVLKNGTQSDEMMYSLQMQMKQLSQMLNEIFITVPDVKSTMKSRRTDVTTDEGELDLQAALSSHPFFTI